MLFRTALMFDLRSAPFDRPHEEIYPAALHMIEYADREGYDNIHYRSGNRLPAKSLGQSTA